jgi:hypothetical protein
LGKLARGAYLLEYHTTAAFSPLALLKWPQLKNIAISMPPCAGAHRVDLHGRKPDSAARTSDLKPLAAEPSTTTGHTNSAEPEPEENGRRREQGRTRTTALLQLCFFFVKRVKHHTRPYF